MSEANVCGAFIEDGYVEQVYLAGVDRLHAPLRFERRPVLVNELSAYQRLIAKAKEEETEAVAAKWAAGRLVSWDGRDGKGQPLAINAANVSRLHPKLFFRLLSVLRGDEAGDIDPDWPAKEAEQECKDRAAAESAGQTLAAWRAERDAKNLPPA